MAQTSAGDPAFGIVLILVGAVVYVLPALVARQRGARDLAGIVVLNLFLGWTLVGWVAALVWAVTGAPAALAAPAVTAPPPAGAIATTRRALTPEQEERVRSLAVRAYPCAIAGMRHVNADGRLRGKLVAALPIGAALRLQAQPDNPVDPDAVSVWRDGAMLGYAPRRAGWIAEAIDEGDALAAVLSSVEEADGVALRAVMLVLVLSDGSGGAASAG